MPIQLVGQPQPLPSKYHCPECKTECPPYGFHMMGGDLGMVGTVQYFTIFCAAPIPPPLDEADYTEAMKLPAEQRDADFRGRRAMKEKILCGHIFAVQVLQYMPPRDPAMLAQLEALMRGQQSV
jgi:hypothetical protein